MGGPLVVYANDEGISKSFRNIPGVDVSSVERLNLLQLAPGGHFGRFCVFTESAVKRLGELFGTNKVGSSAKKGYTLPRSLMTNTDIARIINSNEVQSVLEAAKTTPVSKVGRQRKNPLKNKSVLARMMPYAPALAKVGKLVITRTPSSVRSTPRRPSRRPPPRRPTRPPSAPSSATWLVPTTLPRRLRRPLTRSKC